MEKTMNRIKNFASIGAFSILVLGLPAIASAQYNGGYGGYGNGRNAGYGNGQYGGYGDMRSTIRDLKNRARDFQRELDRGLDHSRYNGSRQEDQMNALARNFKSAVNRLDNNGYNNSRNDNEMPRVFDEASQIERTIGRAHVSYQSDAIWQSIRNDLQILSRSYGNGRGGYNNGNGGYNNGGGGNGRNRNGLPSWWPF
jgi:hypothetical protein